MPMSRASKRLYQTKAKPLDGLAEYSTFGLVYASNQHPGHDGRMSLYSERAAADVGVFEPDVTVPRDGWARETPASVICPQCDTLANVTGSSLRYVCRYCGWRKQFTVNELVLWWIKERGIAVPPPERF